MTDYFTMIVFSTVFIAGMGLGIQMIVGAKEMGGTAWFFVPFACLLIFFRAYRRVYNNLYTSKNFNGVVKEKNNG